MKKITSFLLLLFVLSSCSFFKSNDTLITEKPWVLYSKFVSTYENDVLKTDLILFKKSEKAIELNFHLDGTVHVREDNGMKFANILWNWKEDNNKYFQWHTGNKYADYHVLELTGKKLTFTKSDIYSSENEIMYFRHYDDKDWYSDEMIELMNNSRK